MKTVEVSLTQCVGSLTGETIASRFKDASEDITLVFSDTTTMDVSFAVEAIIKPAQRMHGKGLLLRVHLCPARKNVTMNVQATCAWKEWPIVIVTEEEDKTVHRCICGPAIPTGCVEAFTAVVQGLATAREVSDRLQISISNASNKLTQLWRLGFLVRTERSAETGGIEYVYRA